MRAHELAAIMDPDSDEYRRVLASVKFDLGEAAQVAALSRSSTYSFLKLPAPICLFEVTYSQTQCAIFVAHQESPTATVWRYYTKDAVSWCWWATEVVVESQPPTSVSLRGLDTETTTPILTPGKYLTENVAALHEDCRRSFFSVCNVATAIEVFSCCNVATVEHQPPKFINAKRIAKGKVPFFSYRTLHITSEAPPKKGDAVTAKHASPRLHLRRGHVRRLPDDRRIWVRASLVGDKSKGFANKDYVVDHHEGARAAAEAKGRRGA